MAIIGAGFAGLASAIAFRQGGHEVSMLSLYAASKAGSYFATPRLRSAEKARNLTLRLTPDRLFGLMAGSVSYWRAPVGSGRA